MSAARTSIVYAPAVGDWRNTFSALFFSSALPPEMDQPLEK
jgi:hypothetical protein